MAEYYANIPQVVSPEVAERLLADYPQAASIINARLHEWRWAHDPDYVPDAPAGEPPPPPLPAPPAAPEPVEALEADVQPEPVAEPEATTATTEQEETPPAEALPGE